MSTSPNCRCGPENGDGKLRGSLPNGNSTTFSSTIPTATVDMSHAFEPARTNGRTAKRSTSTPHTAQIARAATTLGANGHCISCANTNRSTAPSITDVPCEKLTVEDTAYVM